MAKPIEISVIIPVYNDYEGLITCLDALQKQTMPRDKFETIIVDNGSTPPITDKLISSRIIRIAVEHKKGSYAARNKGVTLATGDIIAFTDADCIPDKFWLERGYDRLINSKNCHIVGGNVVSIVEHDKGPSIVETYQLITGFSQERLVRERHYAVTANVFISRKVWDAVGPFDDTLKSSGDLEWGQRAHKTGYTLVYADDVIVVHPVRTSLRSLVNQARRVAGGRFELRYGQLQNRVITDPREAKRGRPPYAPISTPLASARKLWNDKRLTKIWQKIAVICLGSMMRVVGTTETLRLKLGGHSKR